MTSLFTRVPLEETLLLLEPLFPPPVVELFKFALRSTYFLFNGKFFEPVDGVAMGPPLSPVVANFYMEAFEKQALASTPFKPSFYKRYVGHTFLICPHGEEKSPDFVAHLNKIHKSIVYSRIRKK